MELSARLEGKIFFLAEDLLLSFGVITVCMTLSCFISAISPEIVKCRESGSKLPFPHNRLVVKGCRLPIALSAWGVRLSFSENSRFPSSPCTRWQQPVRLHGQWDASDR